MAKAIELLFSALVCLLAVLTCHAATPDHQLPCKTAFFDELNESSSKEVRKKLQAVPEDQRDTLRIGKATVAQLLALIEPVCDAKEVYQGRVLSDVKNLYCGGEPNKGASKFFKKHFPKWQKICGEKVGESLEEHLEGFFEPEEDDTILDSLDVEHHHDHQKERDRLEFVYKNQKGLFERCLDLYRRVPRFSRVIKLVDSSSEFIKKWSDKIANCEDYLHNKCRGYISGHYKEEDREHCEAYERIDKHVFRMQKQPV